MPGIVYIGWGILAFLGGHILQPKPKVVVVQDGQLIAERSVESPILIVKDGENFQVRTAKAAEERNPDDELIRKMMEPIPH